MTGSSSSTEHWIQSGDARLLVRTAGRGVPLLMLHGWAMDHRVFRSQIGALARHFRVVTFDRRSFGASSGRPDLNRELDDLDTIAAELFGGEDRFHLLGMSQGGRVALRYAASRPRSLRSLILQGPAVDGLEALEQDDERIPLEDYAALVRGGDLDALRRRWLSHPMMRRGVADPELQAVLCGMLAAYSGIDLIQDRSTAEVDVLDALAASEFGVLLLTGALETSARRQTATQLLRLLPRAREVRFAHSGHLCNLTEPDAYNAAVIDFCLGVERGAGGSVSRPQD